MIKASRANQIAVNSTLKDKEKKKAEKYKNKFNKAVLGSILKELNKNIKKAAYNNECKITIQIRPLFINIGFANDYFNQFPESDIRGCVWLIPKDFNSYHFIDNYVTPKLKELGYYALRNSGDLIIEWFK